MSNRPLLYLRSDGEATHNEASLIARGFHVFGRPPGELNARDEASAVASYVDQAVGGAVQLVSEAASAHTACWLAILHPLRVETLVLFEPPEPDADLVERLAEINAPTLIVCSSDTTDGGQKYRQHIANSQRVFVYASGHASSAERWATLATEFIDRGEAFVVRQANYA